MTWTRPHRRAIIRVDSESVKLDEIRPPVAVELVKMGSWFSRCVEFEYNEKSSKFYLTLNENNETNLAAIYEQLMKTFRIPLDTNITGFVCEHHVGGPICSFRLVAGLRGTILYYSNQCAPSFPYDRQSVKRNGILINFTWLSSGLRGYSSIS